ncbi:MAG: hypothetical protein ACK2UN_01590 [Candidatus Promineifilaceae bacterium]
MIKNNRNFAGNRSWFPLFFIVILIFLAGCGSPDLDPAAETASPEQVATAVERVASVPATWTPLPVVMEEEPEATDPAPPTSTAVPTSTVVPATETPEVTPTDTPEPTATDLPPTDTPEPAATNPPATAASQPASTSEPQPTSLPAATDPPPTSEPAAAEETAPQAEPVLGVNLLNNPSFEEGHYNQDGIPELQLPVKWRLTWEEGPTGLGDAAWDVYVRPEVRVLSTAFLPPEEHALYIYNGQYTVKAFKGNGAVNFQLLTDITLEPGTYVIEAKMFPDIVEKWENRQKYYSQDPSAAEIRFIVGDGGTVWMPQNYGQINVQNYTFTIDQTKTIPIGIGLKGKYAIANNGWFIDDLSVRRIE